MEPSIEMLTEKTLVGMRMQMSLANNRTGELWRSFMPRRRDIADKVSSDLYSMQVYSQPVDPGDLTQVFDKWAAVEVSDGSTIPDGLERFVLSGGLYAVFPYKGSSTDTTIFRHIFGVWLPGSAYSLDDRPHFEVLGDRYKNADPDSEEDIWIPIKPRDDADR